MIHYFVAIRRNGLLTPDGLFVACQMLMLYGTVRLVDPASEVQVFYARLMAGAVAIYVISSMVTFLWLTRSETSSANDAHFRSSYSVSLLPPTAAILAVIGVSILITVAYFKAVGYSAFLTGLWGRLSGSPADIATLRLESYAGSAYFYPGYVNQFKNVILPSLTLVLVAWSFSRSGLFARACSIALLGVSALALMATGQRSALVMFLLTAMVFTFLHHGRRLPRAALVPVILGLPLVLLSTFVLARGAGSAEHPVRTALTDLIARFVNDNQESGIAAFIYTSASPVRYGREWLEQLAGVLPGNRGSDLSGQVFATLYGSTRGTSPPSLWGSIHYNFDTVGVILLAGLFGVLLQLLTRRTLCGVNYNSLELVGIAGVTVVLGTWVAGGIETPLNVGLVPYLGLWYWGSRIGRANRQPADQAVSMSGRPVPTGVGHRAVVPPQGRPAWLAGFEPKRGAPAAKAPGARWW
ncbi:hypothetical protein [Micromonospora sp. NPDC005173]|uniref:hypothetical protein n=1 Tax=Micromonospora sp. NPDC005173 TaxID=3157165 RepID=UPI0033B398CA